MAKERPRDINFYEWRVNAWRASDAFMVLDATGRGIYRDLMDQCYVAGDFEYDPEVLCGLCRCSPDQLSETWKRIEKKFVKRRNGRFGNGVADLFRKSYFGYVENQKNVAKEAARKRREMKELARLASGKPQASLSQEEANIRREEKRRVPPPLSAAEFNAPDLEVLASEAATKIVTSHWFPSDLRTSRAVVMEILATATSPSTLLSSIVATHGRWKAAMGQPNPPKEFVRKAAQWWLKDRYFEQEPRFGASAYETPIYNPREGLTD